MNTKSRELTRGERAAIRKLVVKGCANYDSEYGCLPLDCECCMLTKWWTGAYCKYFRDVVLPLDPALEATLSGRVAPDTCTCLVCGSAFVPQGKRAYCSPPCQQEANRRKTRERMSQRQRGQKG